MTDEEGRLVSVGSFSSTARPYLMVQELMILTNRVVAEHFARSGTPLLFRNHRGNPVADRQALSDDLRILSEGGPYSETAEQRFEMMLGRATLSSKAVGHFGLNLPVYAWLTSPIRRYADLVNQRIVVASLTGKPSPYAQEELDFIGDQLNELAVKDAEEKTEHFKRLATRRAVRRQQRGNIQDLDAAGMKAVIKTAAASNAFSPELGVELGRRLSDGSLSPKNMARILLARGKGVAQAQQDVMRRLEVSANDAVSVLNYLTQENLISGLEWPDEDGTSALVMTASARRNGAVLSATVPGPSKKVAKQRAAVALLAKISGTDWLPPEDWSAANPKVVIQPQPGTDLNSKGALIALCRERGLPTPIFEISQEGPSHAPRFTAYASIETGGEKLSEGPFLAGSRKEAERLSADALLPRLADYKAAPTNAPSAAVTSNPKSALQEFCQRRGWPLPVYEIFSQEGPSHQPSFTGVAQVRAPGGQLTSITVTAASKKEVEKMAAAELLGSLLTSRQQHSGK